MKKSRFYKKRKNSITDYVDPIQLGFRLFDFAMFINCIMMMKCIKNKNHLIRKHIRQEKELEEKLKKDPMTGLYNHSEFYRFLEKNMKVGVRPKDHICIALIDIDHFKVINDTYGHETGNEALVSLATILQNHCEQKGYLYRYGGEEFTIIFKNMSKERVFHHMEVIRKKVEKQMFSERLNITISIGIAEYTKGMTAKKLFERADRAMYLAKNNGRNQTVIYQ